MYTDASTYSARASTADWKIEKKGSSKFHYTAHIYKWTNTGLYSGGSMVSVRRKLGSGTYIVRVFCYKDSKKKKQIGSFDSEKIRIMEGI